MARKWVESRIRKHCSKRISQEKENSKKSPVLLLSPGINTRRTILPPCWIYSMSRGLVSTNQTFFASEHKRNHKDIRTRRVAYLTRFSIPALLNPMINKMADKASAVRHMTFDMFAWGLGKSDLWLVHGLVLVLMSTPFSLVKATT